MLDEIRKATKNQKKISIAYIQRKYKLEHEQAEKIRNKILLERNLEARQIAKEYLDKVASENIMYCMMKGI